MLMTNSKKHKSVKIHMIFAWIVLSTVCCFFFVTFRTGIKIIKWQKFRLLLFLGGTSISGMRLLLITRQCFFLSTTTVKIKIYILRVIYEKDRDRRWSRMLHKNDKILTWDDWTKKKCRLSDSNLKLECITNQKNWSDISQTRQHLKK